MFEKAIKKLPDGITYDPFNHTTIEDLIYLVQHELDLIKEEPSHFEHLTKDELLKLKRKCERFITKYS